MDISKAIPIKEGSKPQPVGTLLYEDVAEPDSSTDWSTHHIICEVVTHRLGCDYSGAPLRLLNIIRLVVGEQIPMEV